MASLPLTAVMLPKAESPDVVTAVAADIGCAHSREALLAARSELVIASRLSGQPGPIDGITVELQDFEQLRNDAACAVALGFSGKLLIHPAQIVPARAGFRPSPNEIAWAQRILTAEGGASAIDGTMVDAPILHRAEQIQRRVIASCPPQRDPENGGETGKP